jgi:hypothetical protein
VCSFKFYEDRFVPRGSFINKILSRISMTIAVTQVNDAHWQPDLYRRLSRLVTVTIPESPELFGTEELRRIKSSQQERDELKGGITQAYKDWVSHTAGHIALDSAQIRWAAGGVIPRVIDKSTGVPYFMFVERDDKSRLSAYAGHSASIEEIFNPKLLQQREFIEEGLIVYNQRVLIPFLGGMASAKKLMERTLEDTIVKVREFGGEVPDSFYQLDVSPRLVHNLDSVNVLKQGGRIAVSTATLSGNVFWNPYTAGLDVISIVDLGMLDINNLRMFDTEMHEGRPLRRNHVLIPEHVLLGYRNATPVRNFARVLNGYECEGSVIDMVDSEILAAELGTHRAHPSHYKLGKTVTYIMDRFKELRTTA